ncbi:5-formyltetrahydrofolate cyclo-ligase [Bacillus cytotoxicus]|uniref:5-formyltetrahydrofolate cyclo-ligase n=1 Tax=Bacillus cytotoxicus TaxID=580165 RepID=UPI0035CB702B
MNEEKIQLRKRMLKHMHSMTQEQRKALSEQIADSLYEQREWKEAETIGITLSMDHEVNTYVIIEKAWQEGKKVVVPKCNRKTRTMTFREIMNWDQLETVYMNLREPIPTVTKEVKVNEIDLLFVPGIAYTRRGERIGYGGGYYDRYLATYEGARVSLAFDFQIVDDIPIEPFDQNVEKIITEKETIV